MGMLPYFLAGVVLAVLGFALLNLIARKASAWTLPALIFYLTGVQSVGFLAFQEPQTTEYWLGSMFGMLLCIFWTLALRFAGSRRS